MDCPMAICNSRMAVVNGLYARFLFIICTLISNDSFMSKKHHLIWVIPTFLLLLVQYRLWFDDTGLIASHKLQQQIAQLEQDNQVHQAENDFILAEVLELRHGQELLEEKAREELGLIKADESFVLFADEH